MTLELLIVLAISALLSYSPPCEPLHEVVDLAQERPEQKPNEYG